MSAFHFPVDVNRIADEWPYIDVRISPSYLPHVGVVWVAMSAKIAANEVIKVTIAACRGDAPLRRRLACIFNADLDAPEGRVSEGNGDL